MKGTQTPAVAGSTTWAGVKAALAAAAGDVATLAGSLVQRLTGINATAVAGVTLENATAPDAGQPAQWPPLLLWKGGARVLGANRVVQFRITVEPTSGGALTFRFQYDLGAGAGFQEAFLWTTATAGQFGTGLAASRIFALGSTAAFVLDPDNSGLFRGGSGETLLSARSATQAFQILGYATAAAIDAIAFQAKGEVKTALEAVFSFGHGTGTSSRNTVITGDGVVEAPDLHADGGNAASWATRAGGQPSFTALIDTVYLVDLSGSDVPVAIPQAVAGNFNRKILFIQVVGGTANVVLTPAAGKIEGVAGAYTAPGVASGTLRMWTLRSLGAADFGWKVQQV